MRRLSLGSLGSLGSLVITVACATPSGRTDSTGADEVETGTSDASTDSSDASTDSSDAATTSDASTTSDDATSSDASTTDATTSDTSSTETTGEPGSSLGVFDLTYYWVAYEGDYAPMPTSDIGTCGGQTLATVPTAFADALALEGSGKLLDERLLNIGGCGCGGGYDCFVELDVMEFPWGQGSQGNPLIPFTTIATDTSVLAFGTSVYVPDLDGQALPGGGTHDGCLRAGDVGGGINGMHFDWFVGLQNNYETLDPSVPEQVEVFEGGTICP